MKTINQLKREHQDILTGMFEKFGVFFAFSQEQLDKQRKEGVRYANAGSGMFIPEDNVEGWLEATKASIEERRKEYRKEISLEAYIEYELSNHECYYTGDWEEALEAVQTYYPECTPDDIHKIYIKNIRSGNHYC